MRVGLWNRLVRSEQVRRVLAVTVAVALVTSGFPTAALAEAADELAPQEAVAAEPEVEPVEDEQEAGEEASQADEAEEPEQAPEAEVEASLPESDEPAGESEDSSPTRAAAEQVTELAAPSATQSYVPGADGVTADELLDAYAQQRIDETLGETFDDGPARVAPAPPLEGATETDLKVFASLKEQIKAVAECNATGTVFTFDVAELAGSSSWTADELGVDAVVVDSAIASDALDAASALFSPNLSLLVDALLAAYPYEMYWYDKSASTEMTFSPSEGFYTASNDGTGWKLGIADGATMSLWFPVSNDYALSTYEVDQTYGTRVKNALADAQSIVEENEGLSAYERLAAYKDAICERVEYNHAAADNEDTPYGDPWQLISVFDGDGATNVVCEGYAKAFKYLCDLSDKRDATAITVTGDMSGGTGAGGHMWNVVKMDDGNNYLVDVTNCDEGSVGHNSDGGQDYLFVAIPSSGDVDSGYTFMANESSINYRYDADEFDNMFTLYGEDAIILASEPYDPNNAIEPEELNLANALVELEEGPFTYSGDEICPAVTVTYDDETLEEGTHYTIAYDNNIEVGEATVTVDAVEGSGYTGSQTLNFEIEDYSEDIEISYTPARETSFEEHTNGWWCDRSDSDGEWFFYEWQFGTGDELNVTRNGEVTTYRYDEDYLGFVNVADETDTIESGYYVVNGYGQSEETPWGIGRHEFEVSYGSATATFEVEIVESHLLSAEFILADGRSGLEVEEYTNGYWNEDDEGQDAWWFYYNPSFEPGDQFVLHLRDGSALTYQKWYEDSSDWVNTEDENDTFDVEGNVSVTQSADEPLTPEHEGTLCLMYEGVSATLPVTITPSPIAAIAYHPAHEYTYAEGTNGNVGFYQRWNEDTEEYEEYSFWHYRIPYACGGDELTVTYTNGEDVTYWYNEDESWFESDGYEPIDSSELSWVDPQDRNQQWDLGEHEAYVEYRGRRAPLTIQIVENPVESVAFAPAQPYEVTEGWDNTEWEEVWDDELENMVDWYRYVAPSFQDGDELLVTYADEGRGTVSYLYQSDGDAFQSADGEVIEASEVERRALQSYANPWVVEGDNNLMRITYLGRSCDVPVTVKANPIESISFRPLSHGTADGYVLTTGIDSSVEETDEGSYQCFNVPGFGEGDELVVTLTDGSVRTYVAGAHARRFVNMEDPNDWFYADSEELVRAYNQDFDNAWTPENPGKVTVTYHGRSCVVDVTIVDNPVEGISFTPAEPYHYTLGIDSFWEETWDDDDEVTREWLRLPYPSFKVGDKLTVTYGDGRGTVEYTFTDAEDIYGFVDGEGNELEGSPDISGGETYDAPWDAGTHVYTVSYADGTCTVPVMVEANPVKAISYEPAAPISLVEGIDGQTMESADGEWFCYHYWSHIPADGDRLILTYTDGTTDVLTVDYDGGVLNFSNESGTISFWTGEYHECVKVSADQSMYHPWGVGEHSLTVSFAGAECTVPVQVVANTIEEIAYHPVKTTYILGVDDDFEEDPGWFYADIREGDELVIRYNDGTSKTFRFGSPVDEADERCFYNVAAPADKSDWVSSELISISDAGYWGLGTHELVVSYGSLSCTAEVQVVENSVTGISLDPKEPYVFIEGMDCHEELVEDEDGYPTGETRLVYDWSFNDGDVLTVSDTVRGEQTYVFDAQRDPSAFVNADDASDVIELNEIEVGYGVKNDEWTVGENSFDITYRQASTQVTVTVEPNSVREIRLESEGGYQLIKDVDGYVDHESSQLIYNPPAFKDGDRLTVVAADGSETTYTYASDTGWNAPEGAEALAEDELLWSSNQDEYPWTDAGVYEFTLSYQGRSIIVQVTIVEQPGLGTAEVAVPNQTYAPTFVEPVVVVTLNGTQLTQGIDYEVTFSGYDQVGTAEARIIGKGAYEGQSRVATFQILAASVSEADVRVAADGLVYNGSAQEPPVTVSVDGFTLGAIDYDVSYANNVNAGTARATVVGKGNYTGRAEVAFEIAPKQATPIVTCAKPSYVYNGQPQHPEVTVTVAGTVLNSDSYDLAYDEGCTELGTYQVTATLKGNYRGTGSTSFDIVEKAVGPDAEDSVYNELTRAYEQAVEVAEQAAADVTAKEQELEAAQADQQQVEDDYQALVDAEDEAKEELDAAEADLATKQTALDEAQAAKDANDEAIEASEGRLATAHADAAAKQSAVEAAEEARAEADATVQAAKTDVAEKQAAYDAAVAAAEEQAAKGSIGFFESVGATDAANVLKQTNLKVLTQQDDPTDAIALDNMKGTFQWLRYHNQLRSSLGLSELKVSDLLMAYAQADANYSDTVFGHAQQFNDLSLTGYMSGENVAWNFGSNPYDQWYDEEKSYFDEAYRSITGATEGSEPTGAKAYEWYTNNELAVSQYLTDNLNDESVGHYTNDIKPDWVTTGFAICTRGTMYGYQTQCQYFGGDIDSYTVDAYEQRFMAYYDSVKGDSVAADEKAAFEEAQGALQEAQAAYDTADQALKDAQAAKTTADKAVQDETETLTGLQGKTEQLSADVTAARYERDAAQTVVAAKNATYTSAKSARTGFGYTEKKASAQSAVDAAEQALEDARSAKTTADEAVTAAKARLDASRDLKNATISGVTDLVYTGEGLTQANLEVRLTMEGASGSETYLLSAGTDYTVSYADNTNAGTATMTITAKEGGHYTGSQSVTFQIQPADLSGAQVTADDQTFARTPLKPQPTVQLDGYAITTDDYTVTYDNNVNAGNATVTITGTGNYTGTASGHFTIHPKSLKPLIGHELYDDHVYSGTAKELVAHAWDGNVELTEGVDFTINDLELIDAGTYTLTVTLKGNYSGTNSMDIVISPKRVTPSVACAKTSYVYNGQARHPEVTVTVAGAVLDAGSYDLAYDEGCTEPGTYQVTATLKGNYRGTGKATFEIVEGTVSPEDEGSVYRVLEDAVTEAETKADAARGELDAAQSAYDANPTPENEAALTAAKGAYDDAQDALATARTALATSCDLANATVAGITESVTYSGKEQTQSDAVVTMVMSSNGATDRYALTEGTDYTVSYADNIDAGTATMTITAKEGGRYTGSKTIEFAIAKAKATVTASNKTITGPGSVALGAKATAGAGKLSYATSNAKVAKVDAKGRVTAVGAGTAKVTVRAAESANYTAASRTVTVTVKKAANPLTAKAKKATTKVKAKKVKKKAQKLKGALVVGGAQGKVTYKLAKAKKTKKWKIDAATGVIKVPKKTKKGTYKLKVTVTAAGTGLYEAGSKTVTIKVKVK